MTSSTDAAALIELAERVEKAVGPDRGLDAEIAATVRYFPRGVGFIWQDSLAPNQPEIGRVECCTKLGTGGPHYAAPAYTASLDAAMMLVPEGWKFGVEQAGRYDGAPLDEAWVWPFDSTFDPDWHNGGQGYRNAPDGTRGFAATPALAPTAACLRAIAAKEQADG